jgi:dTDP-4-dehydrorhamnose 3,5-epimerase-like enzyme
MLAKKLSHYMDRKDSRGSFQGLINKGNWREVNFASTYAGEMRGGHFHKKTREIIFLVRGEAEVELKDVRNPEKGEKFILQQGEGIEIEPYILHTIKYLQESEQIALLNQPFDPSEPDLHTIADN